MKVKVKLFGFIPLNVEVELRFTDEMPANVGGYAYGRRLICIRHKYRDDRGILEHEIKHIQQAWSNPWHGLFYMYSDTYKLRCELDAYKIQATFYSDDRLPLFAKFIAEDYGLDISQEHALELLRL